jgi:hypothetical protein
MIYEQKHVGMVSRHLTVHPRPVVKRARFDEHALREVAVLFEELFEFISLDFFFYFLGHVSHPLCLVYLFVLSSC